MLNYLYSLLYTQSRNAILKADLDPTAGIMHADNIYRDSFAYDVMELVRPDVDFWLLNFINKNKFPKKYFTVMPEGNIRLSLQITPHLVDTIPLWEEKIVPVVDNIRRMIRATVGRIY
jgi:CRISPR-associated protein Cas1